MQLSARVLNDPDEEDDDHQCSDETSKRSDGVKCLSNSNLVTMSLITCNEKVDLGQDPLIAFNLELVLSHWLDTLDVGILLFLGP